MAMIQVIDTKSGKSVYASDVDDQKRRSLLGYISGSGIFHAARMEAEPYHKQRWGEALRRSLEDGWRGRPVP